ncbi:MAG: hypothetical protein V1753_02890, partial [Pseudomonadota bacterium]
QCCRALKFSVTTSPNIASAKASKFIRRSAWHTFQPLDLVHFLIPGNIALIIVNLLIVFGGYSLTNWASKQPLVNDKIKVEE